MPHDNLVVNQVVGSVPCSYSAVNPLSVFLTAYSLRSPLRISVAGTLHHSIWVKSCLGFLYSISFLVVSI